MSTATFISIFLAMAITTRAVFAIDLAQAARVDALFKYFDQPNAPAASVMVIYQGKSVFSKSYGLADLVTKTPCTTNTNVRLASVRKQFTALAVLILAERGSLALDERLPALFPEFPAYGKQITVRQLLTHTSGLIDYEDVIPPGTTLPVLDQDVLCILVTQDKTCVAPGAQYRYSNSGFTLLALVGEARSGQTFARFLQENIFQPLTMANTLAYEPVLFVVSNRAFGPTKKSNAWERTDQSLTSAVLGDGGIYSSLTDFGKWDQSLYRSKLVSERTLRAAFTPHTPTDQPRRSNGYGWYLTAYRGLKVIYHSGETIGPRTRLVRIPERRFASSSWPTARTRSWRICRCGLRTWRGLSNEI